MLLAIDEFNRLERREAMRGRGKKYWLEEIIFIGPAVLFFSLIVLIPFFIGMTYSFTTWNGVNDEITFVGFSNFLSIFKDEGFIDSFCFTAKFTVVSVTLSNIIGLSLAILLTRRLKISKPLRTVFFIPNVISGLLLGFIWQFIFTKGFGAIGSLTQIPFFKLSWLGTESTAFWALIIVTLWQTSGYLMVIYISGIINVPTELKEAAQIDGANHRQYFRHIMIPMIMPSVTVCLFLAISWAFKMFDLNYSLTKGGPYNSTKSIALDIYIEAFQINRYGTGAAKAFIFFVVVALITFIQVRITKRKEVEA